MHRRNYSRSDPSITLSSATDFESWLRDASVFAGAKVILIVDGFDALLRDSNRIRAEFLGALRSLRAHCADLTKTHLWGFVAVGLFRILKLTQEALSPFHITDAFQSPNLTEDEVVHLFKEYIEDYALAWDDHVARDIFQRTNGHAGLVCFCFK